jgi:hypothetical protein
MSCRELEKLDLALRAFKLKKEFDTLKDDTKAFYSTIDSKFYGDVEGKIIRKLLRFPGDIQPSTLERLYKL